MYIYIEREMCTYIAIVDCAPSILNCLMPIADIILPPACWGGTAYCLLPTASCLLATAYCLLSTAYYLMPTQAECRLLLLHPLGGRHRGFCPSSVRTVRNTVGKYSTRHAKYSQIVDKYWTSFWSPIRSR